MMDLIDRVAETFRNQYARRSTIHVAAPGRVNLIGEHVDYNEGLVLPMAVERHIAFAGTAVDGREVKIYSADIDSDTIIRLDDPIEPVDAGWENYLRGMLTAYLERGYEVPGFEVAIESSLPVGGGLSSSAALCVGFGLLIETLCERPLPPRERALISQAAEHRFAGVPCGIMDPFSSALGIEGSLLLLDCRTREITPIQLGDPQVSVLIVNTNISHELSGGEYAERRAQCDAVARHLRLQSLRDAEVSMLDEARIYVDDTHYRRAYHVITEIERTREVAQLLSAGESSQVGELMYASHDSLRRNFEVSCRELDLLVELAQARGEAGGVYGARMTGGGFGGCTVWLVESARADEIRSEVEAAYERTTGIQASSFTTRPAAGARVVAR